MFARSIRSPRSRPSALLRVATCLAVAVVAALGAGSDTRAAAPPSDPRAVAIADQVMKALGGKERWEKLCGLRWTFGAESKGAVRGNPRRHAWDKCTAWHRVEGKQRDGRAYVIVHNLNDGRGWARVDGTRIEGDSLAKLIARGKSLWTNDSYWFLMPYKLRDSGVTLRYAGDTTVAGVTYDRLALSFDHVGETPGDRYWVCVNRSNHRIEQWEYVLEDDQPPPKHWTWSGWEQHAGLWFPTAHWDTMFTAVRPGDTTRVNIFTRDVETVVAFTTADFAP